MAKVRNGKGKGKAIEAEPANKGKKSKAIPVNKNGKISKTKKVQARKGKAKTTASRAKDKALAIKQSYPRGMTRSELAEWRGPKKRQNSTGLFGSTAPAVPTRIDISNGVIIDNKAKKTILGIVRGFWPVGAYTWTDITDKYPLWLKETVIKEFYKFYRHRKGQSRRESEMTIAVHVKALIKRTMNEEKQRALQKSKELKKSLLELRPSYFNDPVWAGAVAYWNTEEHLLRSTAGKENRKLVTNLHSSGAKSFQEQEMILTKEKNGVPPTRLEVWDRTHTRAGNEVDKDGRPLYTTAKAKEIALRYAKILEENNFDSTQTEKAMEPFQWWLMATEPNSNKPKNNRLLGYPRIPARQLIKDLSVQYDDEAENRAETSAAGAARGKRLPGQMFADVVGGVIEILKTDPTTYQRQLNEEEVEDLARAAMNLGNPANRSQFSSFVTKEVLHLVADIVDDMFTRYKAKLKEAMDDNSDDDDVTDISDDEGDLEADGEGEADREGDEEVESDGEGSDSEGSNGEGSDGEGNHEGSSSED